MNHNNKQYEQASQWTLYYDTDEFLAIQGKYENENTVYETPNYVLKRLNAMKRQSPSDVSCMVIPRYGISSIELTEKETNEMLDSTTRKQFLWWSTTSDSQSDALVPSEFVREKLFLENCKAQTIQAPTTTNNDGTTILRRFDTLRYKYHSSKLENYGKSILDLSLANVREFMAGRTPFQTHWAIASICGTEDGNNIPKHHALVKKEHMVCTGLI